MLTASTPRPSGAPRSVFYSLSGGLSELVRALAERLPAESVRTNARVRSVAREGARFVLEVSGHERLAADALIVAAPAHAAAPLLAPLAPDLSRAMGEIRFVSTAAVFLGYRREDVRHPLDGYGLLAPRREGLRTTAMSFFSTKYPGRAPEGHVLLRGFLGGALDPEILDLDDAALVEIMRREAGALLGLAGEPVLVRVYRWPQGTPQMEVGHAERMVSLEARRAGIAGLFLTGAGLRSTGLPDGIADATLVAEAAARSLA
jgi:oxygen-dependent protoporphyrinogen oxidase